MPPPPLPFSFVATIYCSLTTSYTGCLCTCLIHGQHDELRQVAVSLGPIRHDLQQQELSTPFPFYSFFSCYCTLITTYTGCFIDIYIYYVLSTAKNGELREVAVWLGLIRHDLQHKGLPLPFPFHFVFSFFCTLITSYAWSFIDKCFVHSQNDELHQVAVSLGPNYHDLQHKDLPLLLFIPCHHLLYPKHHLRRMFYVPVLSTANTMSYVKSLFRWDRFTMIHDTKDLPLPPSVLVTIYCVIFTTDTACFIVPCLVHSQHDELREVAVSLRPNYHDLQHKDLPLRSLFIKNFFL